MIQLSSPNEHEKLETEIKKVEDDIEAELAEFKSEMEEFSEGTADPSVHNDAFHYLLDKLRQRDISTEADSLFAHNPGMKGLAEESELIGNEIVNVIMREIQDQKKKGNEIKSYLKDVHAEVMKDRALRSKRRKTGKMKKKKK